MGAGAGMYTITFFATIIILIIQLVLAGPSAKIETHYSVDVELIPSNDTNLNDIIKKLSELTRSDPHSIKLVRTEELNHYKISFNITHTVNEVELIEKISADPSVINVAWNAL
jgi:uncharacterized membrane protein YhiD involved in acid resistance